MPTTVKRYSSSQMQHYIYSATFLRTSKPN
jgi:hypothetical protein